MKKVNSLLILIFGLMTMSSFGQDSNVLGRVLDDQGEPLPFANVLIEGTGMGVATDFDGNYRLAGVPPGTYTIKYTFVGYDPVTKEGIEVKAGTDTKVPDVRMGNIYIGVDILPALDLEMVRGNLLNLAAIVSIRGNEDAPIAKTTVSSSEIEKLNNGQDLPYMVQNTPSVVVTSDAGTGIGYTGLRIRGSDQTRINVTINGIPYNDPESQGVFWVNLPDMASSLDNLQIQRGVGSSTNGAGAFGASMSLNTLMIPNQAFAQINNSFGSFNTMKNTVAFGSGLIDGKWKFEGRLSQITSDGYIDRASADLKSYYMSGAYDNGRTSIQALVFGGKERTYQSWYGTPESRLNNDEEAMRTHAANEGYSEAQLQNLLNSGRTYNFYLYENEVDDYAQDHYQLHLNHRIGNYLTAQLSGHYTYGRGFFEQERLGEDFEDYGLQPIVFGADQAFTADVDGEGNPVNLGFESSYQSSDVEFVHEVVNDAQGNPILDPNGNVLVNSQAGISQTDLIRRRWLSNDFYGLTYSLNYKRNRVNAVLGGAYNDYDGDHYGELIWMEQANGTQQGDLYYLNNGRKKDFNTYIKLDYRVNEKLSIFGDVQYRNVTYFTSGIDADRRSISVGDTLDFVNPKVGATYKVSRRDWIYASYSVGNREPVRNDYIDALDGQKPTHETLYDLEFGYKRRTEKYMVELNFYDMQYDNQLVLTGALNDVGSAIRTNVAQSYRRGVELATAWNIMPGLRWNVNATYSQNRIQDYEHVVYDYTNGFDVLVEEYSDTDISFSPDIIANTGLEFKFFDNDRQSLSAEWIVRYVGEQYLDNTSNADRAIDAYLLNDARVTYTLKNRLFKTASLNLLVNNVLNEQYSSNGYTYSYVVGEMVTENFFYPQAGTNVLLSLNLGF